TILRMVDLHVGCRYREIELAGFIQHQGAHRVVGLRLAGRSLCQAGNVILQLEVVEVDRRKQYREEPQDRENQDRRRDPPAREPVHVSLPDSLLEAQSSSHMSSECRVHSGPSSPEICNSSSFSVPCPYGQMYSMRG